MLPSQRRYLLLSLLCLGSARLGFASPGAYALAQDKPDGAASLSGNSADKTAGATTLSAVTRLVNVELVVRDSSGRPVHGLTAKDFTVKEDGKSQQVDLFEDRSAPQPGAPYRSPAAADSGRPNQFSNVPAAAEADGPVNIVLLDLADTPQLDQGYAIRQLVKFCKALPPKHRVALFVLTTRLHILQDLTGSSEELVAAASRIQAKEETLLRSKDEKMQTADMVANWASAIGRPSPFVAHLKDEIAAEDNRDLVKRAQLVSDAFAAIARATAGYSGRKNLIWLAEEFPVGFAAALQMDVGVNNHATGLVNVRETANLVASSQISVFPVALSGVVTEGVDAAMSGASASGNGYGDALRSQFNERRAVIESMNDMARETGGKAFYGTNDFAGALNEVVGQDADEYTLAYRPANAKYDGRYRRISIQPNGQHWSLSYRRGYFARPEGGGSAAAEMGEALRLKNSLDATQVRLRADLTLPQPGSSVVNVDATVDASDLTYSTDEAGRRHAQIVVALLAAPAPADNSGSKSTPAATLPAAAPQGFNALNIDVDEKQYQDLLRLGLHFRRQISLAPGVYRLRMGVAQSGTHRFGTLMMPVTIP